MSSAFCFWVCKNYKEIYQLTIITRKGELMQKLEISLSLANVLIK